MVKGCNYNNQGCKLLAFFSSANLFDASSLAKLEEQALHQSKEVASIIGLAPHPFKRKSFSKGPSNKHKRVRTSGQARLRPSSVIQGQPEKRSIFSTK